MSLLVVSVKLSCIEHFQMELPVEDQGVCLFKREVFIEPMTRRLEPFTPDAIPRTATRI